MPIPVEGNGTIDLTEPSDVLPDPNAESIVAGLSADPAGMAALRSALGELFDQPLVDMDNHQVVAMVTDALSSGALEIISEPLEAGGWHRVGVEAKKPERRSESPQQRGPAPRQEPAQEPSSSRDPVPLVPQVDPAAEPEEEEEPPIKRVDVLEVDELYFATDREIVLPVVGFTDGDTQDTLRSVVKKLFDVVAEYPDRTVLVVGHTDAAGSVSHNLSLSERRAQNLCHLLKGSRSSWAAHCADNQEVEDLQTVLKWISRTRLWPTDPGGIDGKSGAKTQTALEQFRSFAAAEFGGAIPSGEPGVDDWSFVYDLYDMHLAEILHTPVASLSGFRSRLKFEGSGMLGCGEHQRRSSRYRARQDRRVDVLLFEPGAFAGSGSPPGENIYNNEELEFFAVDVAPEAVTKVTFTRTDGSICRNMVVAIKMADGRLVERQTDGSGELRFDGLLGEELHLEVLDPPSIPR